jgi:hypothetical protein
MGDDFILLTGHTSLYVVRYPSIHPLPLVVLFDPLYRFISSWVASRRVVVRPHH